MGAGEGSGFSGNEGCKVFCPGVVGIGCTMTGGAGTEPAAVVAVCVVVDSDAVSDILRSLVSVSMFCWA